MTKFVRFVKDESGATAVEMAIVAMPFLLLLFGIMSVCLFYFANFAIENAVWQAARAIRTGQLQQGKGAYTGTSTDADKKAAFKKALCAAAQLARFYPDEYEPHTAEERHQSGTAGVPARVVRRVNSSVLRLIDARRPDPLPDALKEFYTPSHPGAALLDYGCGSPAFLESAREAGWETIGVDFSERAVQSVREAGHHGYLAADVEGSVEVGSITAIRMSRNSPMSLISGFWRVRNPRLASPPVRRKSLIASV